MPEAEQRGPGSPALSPTGTQLAYGWLAPGPPVKRPIAVVNLGDGTSKQIRGNAVAVRGSGWMIDTC